MHKPVIKLGLIVCFAVCGVFSDGTVTLKTSHNSQTKLLDENIDPCSNNPCRNGGICTVNNEDYICNCKTPYSGKQCEIHPCHSSPCLNEGACIGVENTYGCVCSDPFHGKHCENDPCTSSPCKNGGSCTVSGSGFNCSCDLPFSGKQCEIVCDCGEGGTCQFINGVKSCKCFPGYIFDVDTCKECDCGVNGKCRYENGKRECVCFGGYAEKDGRCTDCDCGIYGKCEFVNNEKRCVCDKNYREKNGICKKINGTLNENTTTDYFTTVVTEDECYCGINSVHCSLDWRGRKVCKCKNNYAPKNETCAATCSLWENWDQQCFNGGRCEREDSGYFCQCIDTYIGDKCEIDVCDSVRFKCYSMRAVCRRKGDTGVCECPAGTTYSWSSDTCEEICDYRTCLNGRCEVRGNSSYICICDEGFYGLHCEIGLRIVYHSVNWSLFLILSVGIVVFSIASIIAAQWVKKLRKKVEEDAKTINP